MLVPALAGVLVLGCQSGGDGGPPTAEEAHRFVEAAESRLKTLGDNASRAGWVQSNFITVDTQEIAANTQSELAAAVSELARGARRFEQLQLPYDDARKLKVLKLLLAAPAPDNKAERDELSNLSSSLEGDYGKGKYCRDVKGKQECLDINAASNILSSSRDPKELVDVWQGWHAVGAPMRDRYSRFVELSNKGARELGFADAGVLWRSFYDMPPDAFAAEVSRRGRMCSRFTWHCTPTCDRSWLKSTALACFPPTACSPRISSATCGRRTGATSIRWWPHRHPVKGTI